MTAHRRIIGLLAAALPLLVYLAWPSTAWNFDGVACASALELSHPVYFFHAQHLLYGFLGFLFWKFMLPLGILRALPALQMFNSLLAAASLYFLWRLIMVFSEDAWLAFFLTCAAGFSAVFWTWSIEAQVYPLGALGLSAASFFLLSSKIQGRLALKRAGFWHGMAVLGHLAHGLWLIPALYWILKEKLPWRAYLGTLAATVGAAYGAVAFFVLRPYHGQGAWLAHWLKGSLGLTPDRSVAWHWPGAWGFAQWAQATPGVLWGTYWPYGPNSRLSIIHALSIMSQLALIGLFIFYYGRRAARRQPLVIFSVLWLGVYALFFSTWEPRTLCYRMTDLLPFTLLLLLACHALPGRFCRLLAAGGWMACLALITFFTRAQPMHDVRNNTVYEKTLLLAQRTSDHALYLTAGGLPWIYLLYFTGRSAWDARTLSLEEFDHSWSALRPRPLLYASSVLLQDPVAAPWLTRHHLKIMLGLPWLEVS